jgi:hypothetical protein
MWQKSIAGEIQSLHDRAREAGSFVSNRHLDEHNEQTARQKRSPFAFDQPSDAAPSRDHDLKTRSEYSAIAHKNS